MDERTKELVAVGAAAAVNCHPCIDHHLAQCDRLSIDRDEVKAAVHIAMGVAKGAAAKTRNKLEAAGLATALRGGGGDCGCS